MMIALMALVFTVLFVLFQRFQDVTVEWERIHVVNVCRLDVIYNLLKLLLKFGQDVPHTGNISIASWNDQLLLRFHFINGRVLCRDFVRISVQDGIDCCHVPLSSHLAS